MMHSAITDIITTGYSEHRPENSGMGATALWVTATCPRPSCLLTVRINGIGFCPACKAALCYRPSPRRRVWEFNGHDAWGWRPSDDGPERVHPDNGVKVTEERGQWLRLPGSRMVFPKLVDHRRTTGTRGGWGFLDRYQ
jgi:hypothetical protein